MGGCGWPKMRRVTMSLQLSRSNASGGGALAVVMGRVRLEVQWVFILARGAVVGPKNQQADGAVLAPGEQHRHLVAVSRR